MRKWWKRKEDSLRSGKKSKCETDKAAYNRAKKVARAEVAKAQQAGRKNFGDMLDKAENRGEVYKVAKLMVRKNKDVVGVTCVRDKQGKLVTEEAKIKMV